MDRTFSFALLLAFCAFFLPGIEAQQLVNSQFKGAIPKAELTETYGDLIRFGVRFYKITYTTVDIEGRPDTASGLIAYPDLTDAIMPLLCYQHGTVSSREDVPSNLMGGYQIAEVFAALGYFSVAPDFLGLGEARGIHPYVHADSEAWAAVDMLFAAREFARQENLLLNDQLFITGYSQGGHAAAALHREIQQNYPEEFMVTASAPMSGPYSISGVMKDLILGDGEYFYPSYLPNTLISYNAVYDLYDDLEMLLKEPYATWAGEYMREEITLSELNTRLIDQLTEEFGGSFPKFMLQDSVLNIFSDNPDHPINRALADNDVYDWTPLAPTRLLYCEGDDQIPFENSILAETTMNANGAPDVLAVNRGDMLSHTECVEPAVTTAILFFSFYQDLSTDVELLAEAPWQVYPNPASEWVRFTDLPERALVELYDLDGRVVLQRIMSGTSDAVSVHQLSAGMYLLRVTTDQGTFGHKLMITR